MDLDGTLVKTDLLWEHLVAALKQNAWTLLLIPLWFLRGRSFLKQKLASVVSLDIAALPYRREVLDFIFSQAHAGRDVVLVTAADQQIADRIATHLGGFSSVYGSDGVLNLKGRRKAEFIESLFGKNNFDYIGDSRADLPVWQASRAAHIVGGPSLLRRAQQVSRVDQVFPQDRVSIGMWLRSLRVLHWAKNALIFLPVLLAHQSRWTAWRQSLLGFCLFGCCASGLYILNDLLDLHADRLHPSKSKRPLAAGDLPLWLGLAQSAVLVGASLIISALVSFSFFLVLMGYALLTIAYSWRFKKVALLDVFVLSSFYTIRIWAGGLISATPVSQWLTAFSLFFFLSLAMAKRHSEILRAKSLVQGGHSGRGYVLEDQQLLAMFGVASSFAAAVILCLYIRSADVMLLYANPAQLLWLCPLVLYWQLRVWLLAGRGELDYDPVLFAVRDRTSWVLAGLAITILAIGGYLTR